MLLGLLVFALLGGLAYAAALVIDPELNLAVYWDSAAGGWGAGISWRIGLVTGLR